MIPRGGLAVMAQRRSPPTALDFFVTPPWATRALCRELGSEMALAGWTCWEPACGQGHMVRVLKEYFRRVDGSDCHDYGYGYGVQDFLEPGAMRAKGYDWIITNPPFKIAEQFADKMVARATVGAAIFERTSFLESGSRYRFFNRCPPTLILQFAERVPVHRGRLDPKGVTATAYCWVVWTRKRLPNLGSHDTLFRWIPPSRKSLEREGDYDSPSHHQRDR